MTKLIDGKYKKRGTLISRRDNANVCRLIYESLLKDIFNEEKYSYIEQKLLDQLNDLCAHKYPTKDYCITKSIKEIDSYKTKLPDQNPAKKAHQYALKFLDPTKHTDADYLLRSLPSHVQLAEKIRRRGMFVEAGSRIEYVVTDIVDIKGGMWQKIESADYYKDHSDLIHLDMTYYCRSLINPVDQVLQVRFNQSDLIKKQFDFRYLKSKMLKELSGLFLRKVEIVNVEFI
jgi:DNA polymerase elongation subunit (family B)